MSAWYHEPIDKACSLAHNACYDRGMADVCQHVLRIALDGTLDVQERLARITEHAPYNPSHRPALREDASKEYMLIAGYLDEEIRHGYIRGWFDCEKLIRRIDGDSEEERLRNIMAFCEVVIDIME